MNQLSVKDPGMALAYITDCTLATVCDLAMKKARAQYEFDRQKSIAQKAINWMVEMNVDFSRTRAADVVNAGSVDAWAEKYDVKKSQGRAK
jgi:hypothetical protein